MIKHVSKYKKVHLLTFCLQTDQGVFTRRAFLKQVLVVLTNSVFRKGFDNNKAFWNIVKSFLTSKGFVTNETIATENHGKIVTDKSKLVNLFNP